MCWHKDLCHLSMNVKTFWQCILSSLSDLIESCFPLTLKIFCTILSASTELLALFFCEYLEMFTLYFLPTLRIIWTLLLVFPLLLYIEYFYHMFIFFLLYSTGFVHIYIYYFVMCYVLSSYVFVMTFGVFFTSKTLNIFPWVLCWEKLMKFINLA